VNFDTLQALDRLQQDIDNRQYEGYAGKPWQDYDVVICAREDESVSRWRQLPSKYVHEYHHMAPRRRVVATRFYQELSWLFERLRYIHVNEIERQTNHDFYAELAETASLYLKAQQSALTAAGLLEAVLDRVRRIYR
jgi:hypothetical protein